MGLDKYQEAAATSQERFLRVLAGAGSGKTRTLIERIRYLVKSGEPPAGILAVTFSRKAATEMRERCEAGGIAGVGVSTLHALGLRILRSRLPDWGVADIPSKRRLIRKALKETRSPMGFGQAPRILSEAKRRLCELDAKSVLLTYERIRMAAKVWDFDDLLVITEEWLRIDADLRRSWQRWSHILVDETQDTDCLQWSILQRLVGPQTNLFIVGDISQSLYSWRGAEPMEMLEGVDTRFDEPFTTLELPRNYRSGSDIVGMANRVVDGKPGGLLLQPVRSQAGHVEWVRAKKDANYVIRRVQAERMAGRAWGDMAILYRTNACSEAFENALIQTGIPYEIHGDYSFYSRAEIKDVLAYLRLAQGWRGADDEADRIVNKPSRYLGAAFLRELADQGGWSTVAAGGFLSFSKPYMRRGLDQFICGVEKLQRMYANGCKPVDLVNYVLQDIGYSAWLAGESPDEADEIRLENLAMLVEAIEQQESVESVLGIADRCVRRPRDGDSSERVQLLTIHRAKGLEWPVVFVVRCDVGMMPHAMSDDHGEELRIFYVATTRAKDRLVIVSRGQDSQYVDFYQGEIEEEPGDDNAEPSNSFTSGVEDYGPTERAAGCDRGDTALGSVSGVSSNGGTQYFCRGS